jgi:uncharacterized repeat protein (TIGR01451 family)
MKFRHRSINRKLGVILAAGVIAGGGVATTGGLALAGTIRPFQGSCNGNPQAPNPSGHLESLLANLTPASGSTVKAGSTVQLLYTDETPMAPSENGISSPTVTIDGTDVSSAVTVTPTSGQTPVYINPGNGGSEGTQCQDFLSFPVPKTASGGSHTIVVTAYDGDGDHDVATFNYTVKPMTPGISILKQVCIVAASKCSATDNADWASSTEVKSGSNVIWRITVTNTGKVALKNLMVTDPVAPGCAETIASLKVKASSVETCESAHVTAPLTNTATVSGHSSSGSVSSSSSATVSIKSVPPVGITSSQSLTPNDEGIVLNGEGATGHMVFSLYPPSNPHCVGTPAFTQTVKVSDGVAETSNFSFIATQPGKWRWLITYTGSAGHQKSGCGVENFIINNGTGS